MSNYSFSRNEMQNYSRSFMKTGVTTELIRRRNQMEYFAPKITQNNPELLAESVGSMYRTFNSDSKQFK